MRPRQPALVLVLPLAACGSGNASSDDADTGGNTDVTAESGTATITSDAQTVTSDESNSGPPTSGATATTSDAESDSAESSSSGEPEPDGIPIFVAQGMVGRTTISCDDGASWVGDRSWDLEADPHLCGSPDPVVCFDETSTCSQMWFDGTCSNGPCDCGHSPGFSKGVEFGNGRFVATWGWGWPGAVATSTNGIDWQTTLDGDTFGGLRFGNDRFVVASRTPQTSPDGITWTASEEADFRGTDGVVLWSVRRFGVSDYDGGRFIAYASGDGIDTLVSSDGGVSWWRPSSMPTGCLGEGPGAYGDIISGNGVIVMADGDGHSCRSTDGGETWTSHVITGERISSSGVWTGSEFWFWGWGNRYSSEDGESWTTTPLLSEVDVGPVARSPEGALVAVNNVWLGYGEQSFLRSTDGLTWETLPPTAFTPGHPIFFITFGYAEPSTACPGR